MGLNKKETIVLIPAYNEEGKIRDVVLGAKKYAEVVVIYDKSQDRTLEMIRGVCKVIKNNQRLGKGFALRRGIKYAVSHGYERVVMIDADGEKDPEDIPKMLESLENNNADLVIGKRGVHRSWTRKFLNGFTNWWVSTATGYKFCDALSGFIAFKLSALEKLRLVSNGFEIETEIVLESQKNGLVVVQLPVNVPLISKSKFKIKHCIAVNNFYDRWIIKNRSFLKINGLTKIFVLISSLIGVVLGSIVIFNTKEGKEG